MSKNPSPARSRAEWQGFTLIELLVVISIIAVLAALAFPAVNGAMDSARKARAKSDVAQIATAVVAYETEYGRLPVTGTNDTVTTNVSTSFVNILIGADTAVNPRNIVFLETSAWKKGKGGTNSSGFCDPWDANSVYQIALDANYNTRIDAGNPTTNLIKKVAVWSTNSVTNRRVTSW